MGALAALLAIVVPMIVVSVLRILNLQLGKNEKYAWLCPYLAGGVSLLVQVLSGLSSNVELDPVTSVVVAGAVAGFREWLDSGVKGWKELTGGSSARTPVLILCLLAAGLASSTVIAAGADRWFKEEAAVSGGPEWVDGWLEIEVEGRAVQCPADLEWVCRRLRPGMVIDAYGPDTPPDQDRQDVRRADRFCFSGGF